MTDTLFLMLKREPTKIIFSFEKSYAISVFEKNVDRMASR